ncbi:MAG: DUF1761 domain-containing protein [Roseivirga sp.]|nr:DUF1761 domain-containing protein [Roseivirga sp.]
MEDMYINHWAVLSAAVFNLILGAIWYSPTLFYSAWKSANNLSDDDLKGQKPAKVYGLSFLLSLIMCYNMAMFLGEESTDWIWGLSAGFLTGFGWAAVIFIVIALSEMRSLKYILINSGFIILYFTSVGLIIGLWR